MSWKKKKMYFDEIYENINKTVKLYQYLCTNFIIHTLFGFLEYCISQKNLNAVINVPVYIH